MCLNFINTKKLFLLFALFLCFISSTKAEVLYHISNTSWSTGYHSTREAACAAAGPLFIEDYNKAPPYDKPATLVGTHISIWWPDTTPQYNCNITILPYTGINTTYFRQFGVCDTAIDGVVLNFKRILANPNFVRWVTRLIKRY